MDRQKKAIGHRWWCRRRIYTVRASNITIVVLGFACTVRPSGAALTGAKKSWRPDTNRQIRPRKTCVYMQFTHKHTHTLYAHRKYTKEGGGFTDFPNISPRRRRQSIHNPQRTLGTWVNPDTNNPDSSKSLQFKISIVKTKY